MKQDRRSSIRTPVGTMDSSAPYHPSNLQYWDTHKLYVRQDDNSYQAHLPLDRGNRAFSTESELTNLPTNATPVKTHRLTNFYYITSSKTPIASIPPIVHCRNTYLDNFSPQERRVIGQVPEWETLRPLLESIGMGTVTAATYGSYDPHLRRATGSWVLFSKDGKTRAFGACPVDGDLETMDS